MQEVVSWAVDQIALEGPKGCTTARLLTILDEALPLKLPSGSSFEVFPPQVVAWLWERLVSLRWEVAFFRKAEKTQLQAAQKEAGKPRKGSAHTEGAFDLVQVHDQETLRIFSDIHDESIHVVAHHSVRDVALGMFDDHLATPKNSDIQRLTLEHLGSMRRKGALLPELCKHTDTTAKGIHHVIKVLKARRLVVQHPAFTMEDPTTQTHKAPTSIVHLIRFSPRLPKEYYFQEVGAERGQSRYVVTNEINQQLRAICAALQGATNHLLREADLKESMGLTPNGGTWRMLQTNLQTRGYVRMFQATVGDKKGSDAKAKNILELLKPYPPPGGCVKVGTDGDIDEEEEDDGDRDGGRMELVAERGLDWHVMALLEQAGDNGLARHQLAGRLGLNHKKLSRRLDSIRVEHGVVETKVHAGGRV